MSQFSAFNFHEKLISALEAIGYDQPTPIQEQAIPLGLDDKDIIASAQTGTGKTAAFLLPCIHRLATNPTNGKRPPRVLVLVPTRELAEQVSKEAVRFCKHLPQIKTVCIYGGMPYPVQNKQLSRPYDILVATPGRLMDHMQRGRIDVSEIETFILDEADRMLDMGFIHDVNEIADQLPPDRQTLLFSATIDRKIMQVSRDLQISPVQIKVEPDRTAINAIEKRLYFVNDIQHKLSVLENLLENETIGQAIIFTSTKIQADRLSDSLSDLGYRTAPLHGDINQNKRNRTLNGLRQGRIQILVATDVAARGIDIKELSHVFNFDIPNQAEDYVHRIGRTGRAGSSGVAITFATYREKGLIRGIDNLMGAPMEVQTIEGLEPRDERPSDRKPLANKNFRRKGNFSGPRGKGGFQPKGKSSYGKSPHGKPSGRKKSFGRSFSGNRG